MKYGSSVHIKIYTLPFIKSQIDRSFLIYNLLI